MRLGIRRSSIEIIADILRLLRLGETGKTEIMYNCNLSYNLTQKYIIKMLELDLLDQLSQDTGLVTFRVTRKGLHLLTAIENMQEMLHLEALHLISHSPKIAKISTRSSHT